MTLWRLALLFTVVTLVESFLLVVVGEHIGPLPTVLLLLLDGIVGAWLTKREGTAIVRQLLDDLNRGLPPAIRLVEGALVLVGAVLLITPGFLTDIVGIFLILPWSRRRIAPVVLRWLVARFAVPEGAIRPEANAAARERPPEERSSMFDHPVR